MCAGLQLLDAVCERLAREIRAGPRHLDDRELERQPWIAALAHVLDRNRQQVDEPDDRRLAELVRLCAQPLARLLGHRQRIGHLAHVLDEHHVAEVLEQVDHQTAEILPLLGELLEGRERARRVSIDDQIAEPEERFLLDRAEQLQHGLHADVVLRRRRELVERRNGVAERAARAARHERERLVRHLDALAVGHAPQKPDELR